MVTKVAIRVPIQGFFTRLQTKEDFGPIMWEGKFNGSKARRIIRQKGTLNRLFEVILDTCSTETTIDQDPKSFKSGSGVAPKFPSSSILCSSKISYQPNTSRMPSKHNPILCLHIKVLVLWFCYLWFTSITFLLMKLLTFKILSSAQVLVKKSTLFLGT